MSEEMLEACLALAALSAVIAIVLLDYRVRTGGSLFTGLASPQMRLLALLLGTVFASFLFFDFQILWLLLSVALTSYGLGMEGLLKRLQTEDTTANGFDPEIHSDGKSPLLSKVQQSSTIGRLFSFFKRWVFILVASGAAIYGALWILGHPGKGEPILVISIVAFAGLSFVVGVVQEIEFCTDLIKRLLMQ